MKIVLNKKYGGFGMSAKAFEELTRRKIANGTWEHEQSIYSLERHDPDFISIVEELGAEVNDCFSRLKIFEIPDGVDYEIEEYDGVEWASEKHQTWGKYE